MAAPRCAFATSWRAMPKAGRGERAESGVSRLRHEPAEGDMAPKASIWSARNCRCASSKTAMSPSLPAPISIRSRRHRRRSPPPLPTARRRPHRRSRRRPGIGARGRRGRATAQDQRNPGRAADVDRRHRRDRTGRPRFARARPQGRQPQRRRRAHRQALELPGHHAQPGAAAWRRCHRDRRFEQCRAALGTDGVDQADARRLAQHRARSPPCRGERPSARGPPRRWQSRSQSAAVGKLARRIRPRWRAPRPGRPDRCRNRLHQRGRRRRRPHRYRPCRDQAELGCGQPRLGRRRCKSFPAATGSRC